jgi:carbamoyltransferase
MAPDRHYPTAFRDFHSPTGMGNRANAQDSPSAQRLTSGGRITISDQLADQNEVSVADGGAVMSVILGINAAFHDSSACLVRDGQVVAAVEEERLIRQKHHKRGTPFNAHALPFHAIDYCLAAGGIHLSEVDDVAYSFDPFLLIDPLRPPELRLPATPDEARAGPGSDPWETIFPYATAAAPRMLTDDVPWHLRERFDGARDRQGWRFHFVQHHLAHAASAFLPAPFKRSAILTLDGRGERISTFMGLGVNGAVERIKDVALPHSLGFFYERLTSYLGYMNSSDEYKVMALASYGSPRYVDELRGLVRWVGDGTYEIQETPLEPLIGPARIPGTPLERRHFDIASSLQHVLEETTLQLAEWLYRQSGEENLCLAGGVALNCVMNSRIQRESSFQNVWVQPAAGDAGTSLGAALWVWSQMSEGGGARWPMDDAYLGPDFDNNAIEHSLKHAGLRYERCENIAAATAACLAAQEVVGWFQGRMEFGPRALGARSIVASPTNASMVERLNLLKDREDYRPVAPAVLEEHAGEYFDDARRSPFMLFVFDVRPEMADRIPAVRHVDGTARIQTVSKKHSPSFYALIDEFHTLTGVPVVVNTSFNTRSRPIVCTPQDALECFYTSPIDVLAIGDFLLRK